jgi:hypothetical protein
MVIRVLSYGTSPQLVEGHHRLLCLCLSQVQLSSAAGVLGAACDAERDARCTAMNRSFGTCVLPSFVCHMFFVYGSFSSLSAVYLNTPVSSRSVGCISDHANAVV